MGKCLCFVLGGFGGEWQEFAQANCSTKTSKPIFSSALYDISEYISYING